MNKVEAEVAKETCKVGQGDDCCAYLVMGTGGFECTKGTTLAYLIDLRLAKGTMNAKGDNCPGVQNLKEE